MSSEHLKQKIFFITSYKKILFTIQRVKTLGSLKRFGKFFELNKPFFSTFKLTPNKMRLFKPLFFIIG